MKPHEEILLKHKDFIWATTKDLIIPGKGNDKVTEILAAYHEIDTTVEVLAECSTCTNIYKDSFKIIWAYCDNVNWFNKIEVGDIVLTTEDEVGKVINITKDEIEVEGKLKGDIKEVNKNK